LAGDSNRETVGPGEGFSHNKAKAARSVRRTGPNQSGGLAIASARMRLGDRGAGTSTKYCACLRTELALL
jgi:hypothetical protein